MTERDFYSQVVLGKQNDKNNSKIKTTTKNKSGKTTSGGKKDKNNSSASTSGKSVKKTGMASRLSNKKGTTEQSPVTDTTGGGKDTVSQSTQVDNQNNMGAFSPVTPSTLRTDSGTLGTSNPNPSSILECYVINKLTEETIIFHAYPQDLSEGYSASYEPQAIMGRSAPYFTYSGNEARSISYTLTLQEDICPNLIYVVERLKGLIYPKYSGSIVQAPYCYLKFGDMVQCYAILESLDFSWGETVLSDSKHFSKVDVSFSYQELRLSSLPTADNVFE